MTIDQFIQLLGVALWPFVVLVALFVVKPILADLLSGTKVKLSISGQVIETTLPELRRVFEELASEPLTEKHINYLKGLRSSGTKEYPEGVQERDEREFLRPLRNAGLIQTSPRGIRLKRATGIDLSALGRLFLQAKGMTGGD